MKVSSGMNLSILHKYLPLHYNLIIIYLPKLVR